METSVQSGEDGGASPLALMFGLASVGVAVSAYPLALGGLLALIPGVWGVGLGLALLGVLAGVFDLLGGGALKWIVVAGLVVAGLGVAGNAFLLFIAWAAPSSPNL